MNSRLPFLREEDSVEYFLAQIGLGSLSSPAEERAELLRANVGENIRVDDNRLSVLEIYKLALFAYQSYAGRR